MLLLSCVLFPLCFDVKLALRPHLLSKFLFLKDMVVRSHHRLHLCADYTLLLLLLFAWEVFHLRLDFLISLGLLSFQTAKLGAYYHFSLDFLLFFD